ncbi:MAG: glycosyltransferase family 4 protein [Lachnospiraceae bacterium]|nr:glycosyltransferase family 4 protein [Lachnospiraceae bacterium]
MKRFLINRYNMIRDALAVKKAAGNLVMPYQKGSRPAGINLYGDFVSGTGISRSVNLLMGSLKAAGIPCSRHQVGERSGIPAKDKQKTDYAINVFHVQPAKIPALFEKLKASDLDGHYNIAYWLWETPAFPREWIGLCDCFDEIWTPSVFVAKALRRVTKKIIKVYPCAVVGEEAFLPEGRSRVRKKHGIPADAFVAGIIYDRRSGSERKNPDASIKAFREAFPDGRENACLMIKAKCLNDADLSHLKRVLGGEKRFVFVQDYLSHEDTVSLLASCDVLLSLHRAEGFGLTLAEMMSCAGVVISTDYSATKEFVNERNGCPVAYKKIVTKRDYSVYRAGTVWAEPDIHDAAGKLRKLYDDPDLRKKLGEEAKRSVSEQLSAKRIGARIRKRVETVCGA